MRTKIEKVATNIYGAGRVTFAAPALRRIKLAESLGFGHFPVCIAKTQFSFSADAKKYGAVSGFDFQIRDIVINAGSEMIVALAGDQTHYMISDPSETAVVEWNNGEMTVTTYSKQENGWFSANGNPAIMTNFFDFAGEIHPVGSEEFYNLQQTIDQKREAVAARRREVAETTRTGTLVNDSEVNRNGAVETWRAGTSVTTMMKREDLMGKRILDVDAKYYVTDHGMRRAVVGGNVRRDIDRTLEAIVYRELVRRGYAVTIGRVKEKEVDFVCQRGSQRLYVQVAYVMDSDETEKREFDALKAVPDQYPKLVLSLDRVDLSQEGIVHRYLPDFLLEAE